MSGGFPLNNADYTKPCAPTNSTPQKTDQSGKITSAVTPAFLASDFSRRTASN